MRTTRITTSGSSTGPATGVAGGEPVCSGWGLVAAVPVGQSELARSFGIGCAAINSIGQLMFIRAFPFWGIGMFAVDLLIICGLAVYGGKRLRTT